MCPQSLLVQTEGSSEDKKSLFQIFFFFFFKLCRTACRILVPLPRIKPGPTAVKAQNPNHWSAREFPAIPNLDEIYHTVGR